MKFKWGGGEGNLEMDWHLAQGKPLHTCTLRSKIRVSHFVTILDTKLLHCFSPPTLWPMSVLAQCPVSCIIRSPDSCGKKESQCTAKVCPSLWWMSKQSCYRGRWMNGTSLLPGYIWCHKSQLTLFHRSKQSSCYHGTGLLKGSWNHKCCDVKSQKACREAHCSSQVKINRKTSINKSKSL